jgi:AcrR family transcriptional regulator
MAKDTYHHGNLKNALIEAGIEILAKEGVYGLSLRKVAREAGVSHSAPYAHFSDKQSLVAAISTEGYCLLYERISAVTRRNSGDPLRELVEAAWTYICFAIEDPDHFKITFSGAVEKETDYPALVAITQKSFEGVRQIVQRCQAAGILNPGLPDVGAVSVWSQVHGLAALLVENQISHTLLDEIPPKALLIACLQQLVRVPIDSNILDEKDESV